MTLWQKVLLALVPSAVLLLLAFVALGWSDQLNPGLRDALGWAPVALTGLALGAALHFHRSRAFFAMSSLVLGWVALEAAAATGGFVADAVFHAASVLLPVNLIVFALIDERGVFTRAGGFRFLLLFLEALFVALMVASGSEKLLWLISVPLFESALTREIAVAPPGLLVMLVALLLLHGRLVLEPSPERAAFFGAAVATVLALYDGYASPWTGTLLGVSGLMFLVSLLQTSWRMAFLDELTGLPGRRALEQALVQLGDIYSIAMLDVDHFKQFNDRYGHDAGDEVLRMVASRLESVGAGGKAYRYGGEEFAIVFPRRAMRETLAALGALRNDIADDTFIIRRIDRRIGDPRDDGSDGREVNITVSIGVAEAGRGGDTPHEVMRAADKALYKAKQAGRNQVCR